MTIYNLYIFGNSGHCIFHCDWKRDRKSSMPKQEEFKLVYGMLHSVRSVVNKLSPTDSRQGFQNFQTNKYKLNYFETASGIKFVMNSDKRATGIQDLLRQIYSMVFVEHVVKNPLIDPNTEINSELFKQKLNDLVQKHSSFA